MRFIHLSDVHLGAVPDRGYPWSARREEELWGSFRRLIGELMDDPVDLLLIAGNLFARQPLKQEVSEVADLFARIPDTRVYLMAGPKDHLVKGSFYLEEKMPPNVYLFTGDKPVRVKDPVLPVYVYGQSYTGETLPAGTFEGIDPFREEGEEGYHFLLARTEEELPQKASWRPGFDYIALGREGAPRILVRDRQVICGSFEPTDPADEGRHGYVLGWDLDGRMRTRFVTYASRSYLTIRVPVEPTDTRQGVEEAVKRQVHDQGPANIYTVFLEGTSSLEQLFFFERLRRLGNILEVVDETRPGYELSRVYERYRGTLVGNVMESFLPGLLEGEEAEPLDPMREKALYFVLQALLETGGLL